MTASKQRGTSRFANRYRESRYRGHSTNVHSDAGKTFRNINLVYSAAEIVPMNHHDELIKALDGLMSRSKDQPVKVGDVLREIREDGFCLICIIHVLPFLQPISLGPVSVAAGLSLTALGAQMAKGNRVPWLPDRMANITPSQKTWRILLLTCEKVLGFCRKLARPRLTGLAIGPAARRLSGIIILLGGLLLAVPLAGIPFSNTIPVLAVLFACIAELEQDGAFMIAAILALLLAVAYFVFLGWAAMSAANFTLNWFNN